MTPNRYAAIDLGSNSVLLLVLAVDPGNEIIVLEDRKATVRLSAGVRQGDSITETSITHLFAVLDQFKKFIDLHQVSAVAACGTHVFRVTSNGEELAVRVRERYGWGVEIISGEEEGRLSYLAAATGIPTIGEGRIVIDVGGASSEVIRGERAKVFSLQSFPLGAVSLSEECQLGDVVPEAAAEEAGCRIAHLIPSGQLPLADAQCMSLAVGGTASSLAAMSLKAAVFSPAGIHGVVLTRDWIREATTKLCGMTLSRRRRMMQFDPERAEIIVGGAMILEYLLDSIGIEEITVSNRGLRWGLLVDRFGLHNRL